MKPIRVGIVGIGMIGRAHWEALRRLPFIEIAAICDHTEQSAKAFAKGHDVPRWYTDYRTLIKEADVDAIHNCTPNRLHDAVNLAAIGAGKHIYAEKPLSDSAKAAYTIWKKAESTGVVHGVNHQYRMHAAVQEMRVRVARGDVGRIFLISGQYLQQSGLYDTDYNWRMTEGGMSCGLPDIGTHWVDTARCVTGSNVSRVFASLSTVHPARTRPDGTRVQVATDDLSCVLLSFENGAQGTLTASKVSAGHQNDLSVEISGQNRSMRWAQENPTHLWIGHKERPNEDLQVSPALMDPSVRPLVTLPGGHPLGFYDSLLAAISEFYAAMRGEIAQSAMRCATFADGFEGMAFVEAAMKSFQTGTWAQVQRSY